MMKIELKLIAILKLLFLIIEYIVEVNIYYQEHRKKTEIVIIREQKWNIILGML